VLKDAVETRHQARNFNRYGGFTDANFEAFTAMMFQVEVFWFVSLYSVIVGYQSFRSPCCLHLQGEVARMGESSIAIGLDSRRGGRYC
jgi:hypothetical protein